MRRRAKRIPRYVAGFEPGWLLGRSLPVLEHTPDYRSVKVRRRWITLTPKQAIVVRLLNEARLARCPLVNGKVLLEAIGKTPVSSLRDAFQRTGLVGNFIVSAGAGDYYLNI